MGALVQTLANQIIDASVGTASLSAVTTPIKVALVTANGSATAAGTEVTGGSYARQTVTFGSAASGSAANNGSAINFTAMPACTVVGVDIFDSTGTPRRLWWGALATNKAVGSGDTFQIAVGALTINFT